MSKKIGEKLISSVLDCVTVKAIRFACIFTKLQTEGLFEVCTVNVVKRCNIGK